MNYVEYLEKMKNEFISFSKSFDNAMQKYQFNVPIKRIIDALSSSINEIDTMIVTSMECHMDRVDITIIHPKKN